MPRFRMLIEYDGSDYYGWQIQADGKTVQGQIQDALEVVLKNPCAIVGAGRTDTGVHACGQVAHFDLDHNPDLNRLKRSLNGILDHDIRIKEIKATENDFHARFSAKWRVYKYQIATQPLALIRNQVWFYTGALNLDKMNLVCEHILGNHNFKSFCRATSEVDNHFCTIKSAGWRKRSDLIIFDIQANRFLHGMVRSLVGTMVDVGKEKLSVNDFIEILKAEKRENASQSAPAKGLILEKIIY
jgi:tRNA pseudouridine38-40 synthase